MLPPILGTRKRVPFVLSCNVEVSVWGKAKEQER